MGVLNEGLGDQLITMNELVVLNEGDQLIMNELGVLNEGLGDQLITMNE